MDRFSCYPAINVQNSSVCKEGLWEYYFDKSAQGVYLLKLHNEK